MENPRLFAPILLLFLLIHGSAAKPIFSARLIHRFSDEASNFLDFKDRWNSKWPEKSHMRLLLGSDFTRQRLRLGAQDQRLVPSDGGRTFNYGNNMGWLHYTWIDLGTPNNSFFVALDTGSDISWVPCECTECAPLTSSSYNIPSMQDMEFREYSPSGSNSSKQVPCSHELCEMGPNCKNPKEHCPYTVNYSTTDTSTSGYLFEDLLHLVSSNGDKNQSSVQASIIIGCGSKQSGEYLNGIAPDGLLALGPGNISVPSLLAKSGLVPRSFSFCYDKSYSGRLYFGDQGPALQQSTPFIQILVAYIVEIEGFCIENTCLKQTGLRMQVDTGSSFTYLPSDSYNQIISEFDRQANATKLPSDDFKYCYMASSLEGPDIPSIKLVFPMNQSLVVESPMFHVGDDQGPKRCIGILPIGGDIGIIGQNFLMGHRMVFDWESLKMGWSKSNCEEDLLNGDETHYTPPPGDDSSNPLPTNEQQKNPRGIAVAPAVAGRAPPKPSAASNPLPHQNGIVTLLLLLWTAYITYLI